MHKENVIQQQLKNQR